MLRKGLTGWNIITLVIMLFFALFIIFPVILVLNKSVYDAEAGRLTFEHFAHFLIGNFIG